MAIPKTKDHEISEVQGLCWSSCPPLKPMENKRYSDINLKEDSGISRSLLIKTATMPSKKNKIVGLLRSCDKKSRFIPYFLNLIRDYNAGNTADLPPTDPFVFQAFDAGNVRSDR
jgi:hypothetical protein